MPATLSCTKSTGEYLRSALKQFESQVRGLTTFEGPTKDHICWETKCQLMHQNQLIYPCCKTSFLPNAVTSPITNCTFQSVQCLERTFPGCSASHSYHANGARSLCPRDHVHERHPGWEAGPNRRTARILNQNNNPERSCPTQKQNHASQQVCTV